MMNPFQGVEDTRPQEIAWPNAIEKRLELASTGAGDTRRRLKRRMQNDWSQGWIEWLWAITAHDVLDHCPCRRNPARDGKGSRGSYFLKPRDFSKAEPIDPSAVCPWGSYNPFQL
jgi:hypothetical protein